MSIAPGGPRHRIRSVFMETSDVVQDPGQVRKWARGELKPTQPAEQRLRFAHDVIQEVESSHGLRFAQAWAMSINPRLGFESPTKGNPGRPVPGNGSRG